MCCIPSMRGAPLFVTCRLYGGEKNEKKRSEWKTDQLVETLNVGDVRSCVCCTVCTVLYERVMVM